MIGTVDETTPSTSPTSIPSSRVGVHDMACRWPLRNSFSTVFLYTKALAQDQYPKVKKFASAVNLKAEVFDGDVGAAHRSKIIQERPDIIVTNFDVLHYHMMRRTSFASLLANVRFVIADEAHVYTGTNDSKDSPLMRYSLWHLLPHYVIREIFAQSSLERRWNVLQVRV